jgi:hypothetical protein
MQTIDFTSLKYNVIGLYCINKKKILNIELTSKWLHNLKILI